jgi:hypothetical protein
MEASKNILLETRFWIYRYEAGLHDMRLPSAANNFPMCCETKGKEVRVSGTGNRICAVGGFFQLLLDQSERQGYESKSAFVAVRRGRYLLCTLALPVLS